MKKPASLRAVIEATVPDLKENPDRLIMWIDQGSVASPMTASLNFAYSYRLKILILGYAGKQIPVAIAILYWLRINQPDLLQPGKSAFNFEADFNDNKSVDLEIDLQLTEQVVGVPDEDGLLDLDYLPEPDPLFPDDLPYGGAEAATHLSEIRYQGERLVPRDP